MGWDKAFGRMTEAKAEYVRMAVTGVHKSCRTQRSRNNMIIYIGCTVLSRLGWAGNSRINLFWGAGPHEGWLRIELNDRGTYKMRQKLGGRASAYFKSHQTPTNGGIALHASDSCKYHVTPDRALEIKPPGWFWSAEKNSTESEAKSVDKTVSVHGKPQNSLLTARQNGNAGVS